MMKKLLPILLMLLTLTFACAEEVALPAFPWERDMHAHWQLAEDGAVSLFGIEF